MKEYMSSSKLNYIIIYIDPPLSSVGKAFSDTSHLLIVTKQVNGCLAVNLGSYRYRGKRSYINPEVWMKRNGRAESEDKTSRCVEDAVKRK